MLVLNSIPRLKQNLAMFELDFTKMRAQRCKVSFAERREEAILLLLLHALSFHYGGSAKRLSAPGLGIASSK
jgi:hypothetical protein